MEKVFNRKKELIRRDPLYDELCKTFKRIRDTRKKPDYTKTEFNVMDLYGSEDIEAICRDVMYIKAKGSDEAWKLDRYMERAIRRREIEHKKEHRDAWKLFGQIGGVEYKWQVLLKPNFSLEEISIVAPHTNPEVIWVGTPSLIPGYMALSDLGLYPRLYWSSYPNPFKKSPILCDINEFVSPVYNKTGEKWIPILVNVSRLNKGDEKIIKKQIWSVIEANLQKGRTKKPHDEFIECTRLYHFRDEETFQNYLRWYDLHIGTDYNKPNGYTFRAIAFGEYVLHHHPELYDDTMKKVVNRTKVVRSARGERVLKGYIGEHVPGEDAVGRGVKIIYKAIHRKPYPSKKTKLKEYNCPTHKASCPKDCPYAKSFRKDFNKAMMQFKPLYTTDPADLPQVIGEERSHSKRKPTADKQSNTK